MANVYIFVTDEAASKIKEMIPEAEVNENCFVEIKNENYGVWFDTRTVLCIFDSATLKTVYEIPAKWIKTIFSL